MYSLRDKVWRFALASRVFVIALQCVSNILIPDHETKVFVSPSDPDDANGFYDYFMNFLLGGLARWDGQYFLHIAKFGYTYENNLAFFPLASNVAKLVTVTVFSPFDILFTWHSLLLLAFTIINVFCFVKTALIIYYLSLVVLKDDELAYRSAIFFCLNPASIFFTAPYSESIYALCTFSGLLCSAIQQDKSSTLYFGLSSATRSNGILNIGFTMHKQLRALYHKISTNNLKSTLFVPLQVLATIIPLIISIVVTLVPFILFQIFSYNKFCYLEDKDNMPEKPVPEFIINYAFENDFKVVGKQVSVWCNSTIPLAYSYVQDHYWDVGFLKYYQLQQIPNFLLALPVIGIMLYCSVKYFLLYPRHCQLLGFPLTNPAAKKNGIRFLPPEAFLYVAHAFCLTIFCILFIHIQVTTRMLASSTPVLYWFAAYMSQPYTRRDEKTSKNVISTIVEPKENMRSKWKVFLLTEQEPSHIKGKFIKYYFMAYMVIGTILFSNHFPWT